MRDHQRDQQNDRAEAPAEHPFADSQRGPWTAGQIVMGPSFYVWDESPRQAREWGVELAKAWLTRRR
jgi:hypothetical protein